METDDAIDLSYEGDMLFKVDSWEVAILQKKDMLSFILEPKKNVIPKFRLTKIKNKAFFRNGFVFKFFDSGFIKVAGKGIIKNMSIDSYGLFSAVQNPLKPINYEGARKSYNEDRIINVQAAFIDDFFEEFNLLLKKKTEKE